MISEKQSAKFIFNTKLDETYYKKLNIASTYINLLKGKKTEYIMMIPVIIYFTFFFTMKLKVNIIIGAILSIISMILVVVIFIIVFFNKAKKKFSSDEANLLRTRRTIKFYDDNITYEIHDSEQKFYGIIKYSKFIKFYETKLFFIMFISEKECYFICKKDIQNLNEFREFISNIFGNKYKKINIL